MKFNYNYLLFTNQVKLWNSVVRYIYILRKPFFFEYIIIVNNTSFFEQIRQIRHLYD